jgi:peptidoglycan/LPS O-acetylase OafA/YrhL
MGKIQDGYVQSITTGGNMIRFWKIALMIIAFLIVAAVLFVLDDVGIIDSMAASFTAVISLFLGVDLAAMIKNSAGMPKGQYQSAHTYRYIIAVVMMLILFIIALYRKESDNLAISMAAGAFGSGSIVIIGLLMSGLEGNKIASRAGEESQEGDE